MLVIGQGGADYILVMFWNPEGFDHSAAFLHFNEAFYSYGLYMCNMLRIWALSAIYRFSNSDSTLFILNLFQLW